MYILTIIRSKIFLDAEFIKVVLWNNYLPRKINQISFPSDVGDLALSFNLKLDMLISKLLKNQSSQIQSLSNGMNVVASIYRS